MKMLFNLDIRNDDADYLIEKVMQTPFNVTKGKTQAATFLFGLCQRQKYDSHEFWARSIPVLDWLLSEQHHNPMIRLLFHTVIMLKLEAPELFARLENVNKILAKKLLVDY